VTERVEVSLPPSQENRLRILTNQENEDLELVHWGLRNTEIASRLGISVLAVRKHPETIVAKRGVDTRTAAAALLQAWLSVEKVLQGLVPPQVDRSRS
jgi:DNA-binding CsgD family transcriptional regulator